MARKSRLPERREPGGYVLESVTTRSAHACTVFRSNRNIFAQIVDDRNGVTLVQASTLDKDFRKKPGDPFNADTAREVGKRIAARAKERNIVKVVFDRGPYLYHGKVKALADGARDGGLDF